jgi:uncharacterized protein DUF1259
MSQIMKRTMLALLGCLVFFRVATLAQDVPDDYQEVLKSLDRKGDFKDGVLKVNIPRSDLKVTVQGVATPTPFGFGGWVAFTKTTDSSEVMMGDLVLLQEEVNPVMSALLDNEIEVTALHNHFFWDDPHLYYMHVHGMGKAASLVARVKPALDLIGHVKAEATTPLATSGATLDTAKIAQIVGHTGEQSGAVYKITVGRNDIAMKDHGAAINARMGLNTWAAFYGTQEDAVVAGDVAMLESEATPVLKTLRKNGIEVVAIHHHMTEEKPMVIFLHYWGRGPAEKLANAFKATLGDLGKKE